MLQPPEGRPDKRNESRVRVSQSLNFANGCGVIGRRSEVLAIALKKRYGAAVAAELIVREVLVDKNKCVFRRNQRFKILPTEPNPMVPQFRTEDGLTNNEIGRAHV